MSSPFKMAPKTPFMKALVGKQGNLPQHLKQAILDAPAKKVKPGDIVDTGIDKAKTKEIDVEGGYRGQKGTSTTKTVKRSIIREPGQESKTAGERKQESTMATRKGEGRIGKQTTVKAGSTKNIRTGLSGTAKDKTGRTKYRTVGGKEVVVEGTVSTIKPRGVDTGKKKSKGKSPAKSYGKSPAKMTGGKSKNKTKQANSGIGPKPKIVKGKNTTPKLKQTKAESSKNYRTGAKSPAKMKGVKALKKKK
jgi:hypothetical protein